MKHFSFLVLAPLYEPIIFYSRIRNVSLSHGTVFLKSILSYYYINELGTHVTVISVCFEQWDRHSRILNDVLEDSHHDEL
jgi:hypothetical protein